MNIVKGIKKVNTFYSRYGWNGVKYLVDTVVKKDAVIEFHPKHITHPVYLRNNTSDIPAFSQIFQRLDYDIDFGFVPETIVDCGANAGFATVFFKNRYPGATIIAVEPEVSNFNILVKNTEKYADVHCINNGIWDKTTNLKILDSGEGKWAFTTEEVNYEDEHTIKAISIGEIMRRYNLSRIDVLKIDIEGSEKELFEKNYDAWLPHVKCIIIELHDWIRNGCTDNFYKTLSHYKYRKIMKGENAICFMEVQ